jgi:hypothetical protein
MNCNFRWLSGTPSSRARSLAGQLGKEKSCRREVAFLKKSSAKNFILLLSGGGSASRVKIYKSFLRSMLPMTERSEV